MSLATALASTGASQQTVGGVLNNSTLTNINADLAGIASGSLLDQTLIQYASVAVTNAQVKALFGTGVQIIAAPAAGSLIEVVSAVLEHVFGTAAFTLGGVLQLSYGTGVTIPASATVAATFLTAPAAKQAIVLAGVMGTNLVSAVSATAIRLACATQEFATGDGTMLVKVAYRIHVGL